MATPQAAPSAQATPAPQTTATSPPPAVLASGSTSFRFVVADVFEWLPGFTDEPFDLVIVDPPAMTTRAAQVPSVLAAYRKLYRAAARLVRPGGILVAACCTSRIERAVFQQTVRESLGERFTLQREIAPEPDHPVGFPQADYLKIGWWMLTA
jgi:23S rRNA (cytosine1962-C5)-methyltransferase